MTDAKMEAFLIRERGAPQGHRLYFCRGPGKCTKTALQKMRMSRLHERCTDCVPATNEKQTLGDIAKNINRGDA